MLDSVRKKSRPVMWYGERTKRDGRYTYTTTALFPLPHVPKDRVVLGGAAFEPGYLKETFFPEMLESLIAHKLADEGGNRLAMVVYPAESDSDGAGSVLTGVYGIEPFAASAAWTDGKPEVSRNLSDAFDGLALGIKFQGTSVAALGRRWIMNSFIILGVLSLLLVGGLVLTYRSVSKEVALARLKSDFVSNVSHELRTPLSLIRLYAETLELRRIKGEQKTTEYYAIIRKESERLTALINNILDFSRIEAGRKEYEFRQTDLAELVTNTLDTYRDQIDEHGFTFERSIDLSLPPVRVDQEAIARSLVNLVNNALKYLGSREVPGREAVPRRGRRKARGRRPRHRHRTERAIEDLREVLSGGRPAGPQHEGQWPWPVARAPHRARARRRGGRGERAGKRQQIHVDAAARIGHAAARG